MCESNIAPEAVTLPCAVCAVGGGRPVVSSRPDTHTPPPPPPPLQGLTPIKDASVRAHTSRSCSQNPHWMHLLPKRLVWMLCARGAGRGPLTFWFPPMPGTWQIPNEHFSHQ